MYTKNLVFLMWHVWCTYMMYLIWRSHKTILKKKKKKKMVLRCFIIFKCIVIFFMFSPLTLWYSLVIKESIIRITPLFILISNSKNMFCHSKLVKLKETWFLILKSTTKNYNSLVKRLADIFIRKSKKLWHVQFWPFPQNII